MISSHEVSAPSGSAQWQSIDWKAVERHVLGLQMRIAKSIEKVNAVRRKHYSGY
nr:hypothetical protein [Vibrio rotiferianus]